MGIEPMSKAWEAFVLPLNYARTARILRQFRAHKKGPPKRAKQGRREQQKLIHARPNLLIVAAYSVERLGAGKSVA